MWKSPLLAIRRVQRAIIDGVRRLCQIHLAFMSMDPDPNLFQVNMAETSSAEEEELKSALDKGVDVVEKLADLILKYDEEVDKADLLDYLNQKILKLGDLQLSRFHKKIAERIEEKKGKKEERDKVNGREEYLLGPAINTDVKALLPTEKGIEIWERNYKKARVKVEPIKEEGK